MDHIKTYFDDLRSEDAERRFSVFLRMDLLAWTPELDQVFSALLAEEKDPRVRSFVQRLVAQKKTGRPTAETGAKALQQLETLLRAPKRDEMAIVVLLREIDKTNAPLAAMALREAQWQEFSAPALAHILKFFHRFGSYEDIQTLEILCRHHEPKVVEKAVEALEKFSPDSLKDLIVPLLLNPQLSLRTKAIRILHRWDAREAALHLESMLFSMNAEEVSMALTHAFFFPFHDVEPMLMRFLALNDCPSLLGKAGALFIANPALEVAERLIEVRENSRPPKRQIIAEILVKVVTSIHQAGLLQESPQEILQTLENNLKKRQDATLLEQCVLALQSAFPESKWVAVNHLQRLYARCPAEVAKVTAPFLVTESDPDIAQALRQLSHSQDNLANLPESLANQSTMAPTNENLTPKTDASEAKESERSKQPPSEAAFTVPATADAWQQNRKEILARLSKCDMPQKLDFIRFLRQSGNDGDTQILLGFLNDSHPPLVMAAVESLSSLCPEILARHLPDLLRHENDQVKAVSLQAFALVDKKAALAEVEAMLFAADLRLRALAIFSLSQLEFPVVRELVLQALGQERDPDLRKRLFVILRPHLDELLMEDLLVLAGSPNSRFSSQENAMFGEWLGFMVKEKRTRLPSQALLQAALSKKVAARIARENAGTAYSVARIKSLRNQKSGTRTKERQILPSSWRIAGRDFEPAQVYAGLGVGLLVLLVTGFFLHTLFSTGPTAPVVTKSMPLREVMSFAPGRIAGAETEITGTIIKVGDRNRSILLKQDPKDTIVFQIYLPARDQKQSFAVGQSFSGRVRPFRNDLTMIRAEAVEFKLQ